MIRSTCEAIWRIGGVDLEAWWFDCLAELQKIHEVIDGPFESGGSDLDKEAFTFDNFRNDDDVWIRFDLRWHSCSRIVEINWKQWNEMNWKSIEINKCTQLKQQYLIHN